MWWFGLLEGKRNPEHSSVKRQPPSFQLCLPTWQPSIQQGFSYARAWDPERRLSFWLPSESNRWQIDCHRLAWESFHSECLSPRLAAYTESAETKGPPAEWWHHPGQSEGRCPAGPASGSVSDNTPGLFAFLHIFQLCSVPSFHLLFLSQFLLPARWDGPGPRLHPSLTKHIFPSVHVSVLVRLSLGTWLLEEGSDILCQGTSLLLSLFKSHFSSVPTLPIFYTPHSSPAFLPCLSALSTHLSSSPPSFTVPCGCLFTGTNYTSHWHLSPLLLLITSIFSLCHWRQWHWRQSCSVIEP